MKTTLLIIAALTATFSAFGACPKDPTDPFAKELHMPAGPYKGRCINSNSYRSVRSLTQDELTKFGIKASKDNFVIANFRHLDKFWIAQIPLDAITGVEFQKMSLMNGLPLYHGQLRYKLKGKSIRLIAQKRKIADRMKINLVDHSGKPQDFVIALFGVRDLAHDGDAYNPLMGINVMGQSKYALSYAFQSFYDGSQWALNNKQNVQQYKLALSAKDRIQIVHAARGLGDKYGISEMYDLITNNCLNFVFRLLNLAKTDHNTKRLTYRPKETIEPIGALKKLGLIKNKSDHYLLEDEFPRGIDKIEH